MRNDFSRQKPGWSYCVSLGWVLLLLLGCGREPASAPPEAANQALAFYQALARSDWAAAYACLHPNCQRRWRFEQFRQLAQNYCRHLGFVPEDVHLRSWSEKGEEAVVHVVLRGQVAGRQRIYRDGLVLRRGPAGWGVLPPSSFGRFAFRP